MPVEVGALVSVAVTDAAGKSEMIIERGSRNGIKTIGMERIMQMPHHLRSVSCTQYLKPSAKAQLFDERLGFQAKRSDVETL